MAKHKRHQRPRDTRKPKEESGVGQVSSKDLIPPVEPAEPTEADVDFSNEEADLDKQLTAIKAKKAALAKRKKQAVGGKKLGRIRKYATETVEWAAKAKKKADVSLERAQTALAKLDDYETKLGILGNKRVSDGLAARMERVELVG